MISGRLLADRLGRLVKENRSLVFWCVAFSAFAHAFRWFNSGFCHDSLLVYQKDGIWQLFLGRWLVPFWLLVRGKIAAPWLIAAFSVLFFSTAVILLKYLLGTRNKASEVALCAVLASCPVVTCLYSTVISATDIHMLAFALAVLSVLFVDRVKYGWIAGGVSLALSMALYQTYLEAAVVLFIFLFIRDLTNGADSRSIRDKALRVTGCLALGCSLYILVWLVSIRMLGYNPATLPSSGDYNDLKALGGLFNGDFWRLCRQAYTTALDYVISPETLDTRLIGALNILIALLSLMRVSLANGTWGRRLVCLAAALSLPLAADFVFVLSGGVVHTLMLMPLALFYAGALMTCSFRLCGGGARLDTLTRNLLVLIVASVSVNFIVYANQAHLKRNLDEQATLSVVTRIIGHIESVDGYEPGDKVVFVGELSTSPIHRKRDGFYDRRTRHIAGSSRSFTITYHETYRNYFENILAYPIVIADREETRAYSHLPEVMDMPSFPSKGCAKMIGDALVVKISDILVPGNEEFHRKMTGKSEGGEHDGN